MKPFKKIFVLLLASVCLACAGGKTVEQKPAQHTAGMQLTVKGMASYNRGCYQNALDFFFMAHESFSAYDQTGGVAMSLNNIGNVYRIIGEIDSAVLFFNESLETYTRIGDHKGMVQVLSNKAAALIEARNLEEAAKILDKADEIVRKTLISYGPLLNNRGILLTKNKDYAQAETILKTALAGTDPADLSAFATVNFALGNLMLASRRYENAVDYFETALQADRSVGFYKGIADDLDGIGSAHLNLGQTELAADFFKRSIKIYALIQNEKKVRHILDKLEKISQAGGQDIRVTLHFVNKWLEGQALESPCE